MTRFRVVFSLFLCFGSAARCLGADDAAKPARRIGSPEHFEIRAAWFLQRMIKADLALNESKAHALDLVFADYYRRTVEQLPRPVLIAYPISEGSAVSTEKSAVVTAPTGQHIGGEIQRRADGSPVMLVENILAVLDAHHEARFRLVLNRWAQIKPEPISIPIITIMRASKDPLLRLKPKQSAKIEAILHAKAGSAMAIGASSTMSSEANPTIERIRGEVVAVLSPEQRAQFEASMAFVEEEVIDWRALKTGGTAIYDEAISLLAEEAKKKEPSGK